MRSALASLHFRLPAWSPIITGIYEFSRPIFERYGKGTRTGAAWRDEADGNGAGFRLLPEL
jgi:hypothetical protein